MSELNDGGTAFPIVVAGDLIATGMSLRDYFAAKIISNIDWDENGDNSRGANACYRIADAMLRAREHQK